MSAQEQEFVSERPGQPPPETEQETEPEPDPALDYFPEEWVNQ